MRMTSDLQELALIHEHDHPGYLLVAWYDAAFPAYELYLRARLMVEEPLPPIPQFILRAVDAGMNHVDEVSAVLGLQFGIVAAAVDELEREGCIVILTGTHKKEQTKLVTTTRGRQLLADLVMRLPREDNLNLCLDALTGEYLPFRRLPTADAVKDEELHQITAQISMPSLADIDLTRLRRFWRQNSQWAQPAGEKTDLIGIVSVENAFIGYRSMYVLQYASETEGSPLVHVYDGVERSARHEVALMKMAAAGQRCLLLERKPRSMPEQLADPVNQVLAPSVVDAARRKSSEGPRIEDRIGALELQLQQSEQLRRSSSSQVDKERAEKEISDLKVQISELQDRLTELNNAAPTTQVLSMAEHRAKLLEALAIARHRVIIVSPWLSQAAVDFELRKTIHETIGRGVDVWIGYGFGEDDNDQRRTLDKLSSMQRGRSGAHLRIERLSDTHAKVVICDEDFVVTTSFNWLSFRGREDWGNRVEFGMLTREAAAVQALTSQIVALFPA